MWARTFAALGINYKVQQCQQPYGICHTLGLNNRGEQLEESGPKMGTSCSR